VLRTSISCEEAVAGLDGFDAVIDVRSPAEFAQDHLPGAVNCPVLDDEERARVGTAHKADSAFAARRQGAALAARNIARHLEQRFADQPRQWRPLVYCWRGGQRSGAMVHVLAAIGWPARQLEGGYRAFRRHVVAELQQWPRRFSLRVVCGPTGSGKSRLLRQLAARGAQVLDLEEIAVHRGSVLGARPLPQPTQKHFETQLWSALRGFDPARPVFVESESRKVGQLRLPDALIEHMRASACVRLQLPVEARIRLLRAEYAHFEDDAAALTRQLDCLADLHGRERVGTWKRLAEGQCWDEMVRRLLEEHYDPAYHRSIGRNFRLAAAAVELPLASEADDEFDRAAGALLAAGG
jgi:tRNA 2-selenouridine synthase